MHQNNNFFLDSLLSGNSSYCSNIVKDNIINNESFLEIYENLFKPSLYKIGELWEYNQISVATEHLASAIVEGLMNEVYLSINKSSESNLKVVLTSIEKEYHQIGLRMVNDVFEANGCETFFLGANTPVRELISFLNVVKPDVLAISLSIYFHLPNLQDLLLLINKDFPQLKVLVGGQAFNHGGNEIIEKFDKVTLLKDLKSLDLYIKNFNKNG